MDLRARLMNAAREGGRLGALASPPPPRIAQSPSGSQFIGVSGFLGFLNNGRGLWYPFHACHSGSPGSNDVLWVKEKGGTGRKDGLHQKSLY
jgi:hypothetical protein